MTKLYDGNIVPDCPVIGMIGLSRRGWAAKAFPAVAEVVTLLSQTKENMPKLLGESGKHLGELAKTLRRMKATRVITHILFNF